MTLQSYNPKFSTAWSSASFSYTNLRTTYNEHDWNKSLGCIDYCMTAWPLCRYVSRTITERQNENTRLNHKVDKLYNSSSVLHVHVYCLSFILRAFQHDTRIITGRQKAFGYKYGMKIKSTHTFLRSYLYQMTQCLYANQLCSERACSLKRSIVILF